MPNPGDHPELVAVLRGIYGSERGHFIEILDVLSGNLVGGWHSIGNVHAMPMSRKSIHLTTDSRLITTQWLGRRAASRLLLALIVVTSCFTHLKTRLNSRATSRVHLTRSLRTTARSLLLGSPTMPSTLSTRTRRPPHESISRASGYLIKPTTLSTTTIATLRPATRSSLRRILQCPSAQNALQDRPALSFETGARSRHCCSRVMDLRQMSVPSVRSASSGATSPRRRPAVLRCL